MKWKTDLHLNKTEVRVESVVKKLGEATKTCLKRLKRKAPSACKEEEVKRVKKDDGHDDQGQGHHEGEKGIAGVAGMSKTVEESEVPTEVNPEERAEEAEVPTEAEAAEANPEISEGRSSSPPLYLSELPIEQRSNLPPTIEDQQMFNLTPAALDVLPKPEYQGIDLWKYQSPSQQQKLPNLSKYHTPKPLIPSQSF